MQAAIDAGRVKIESSSRKDTFLEFVHSEKTKTYSVSISKNTPIFLIQYSDILANVPTVLKKQHPNYFENIPRGGSGEFFRKEDLGTYQGEVHNGRFSVHIHLEQKPKEHAQLIECCKNLSTTNADSKASSSALRNKLVLQLGAIARKQES
jgi:hypothetical protein